MAESESVGGKGVIPHFFYDVISFIIPGSYLIFGIFLIWFGQEWSEALYGWTKTGGKEEGSIAATSVLVGIAFIIFLAISSFVGFLLSALSYKVIEIRIWGGKESYTMLGLETYMGIKGQGEKLKGNFNSKFELDLEDCKLDQASNLCAYYIWDHSPLLGTMTGRFDAEKIMSQSSILVSFLLAALDLIHYVYAATESGAASLAVFLVSYMCLLLCAIVASFAFDFHREKRVYGRYQMFLMLVAKEEKRNNDDATGKVDKT